ncbi:MAG: GNAT family protein [bacterium]
MVKIPTIDCGTFVLRQLNKKDAESLSKNADNKKIAKNLTDEFPSPYTVKNAEWWIRFNLSKKNEKVYTFGIEVGGKVCGCISLYLDNKNNKKAATGYWIGEAFWGRGIMSVALEKVVNFGFKELKLKRIEASVYPRNEASASVLINNGFEKEGYLKKSALHAGKLMDEIIFAKVR